MKGSKSAAPASKPVAPKAAPRKPSFAKPQFQPKAHSRAGAYFSTWIDYGKNTRTLPTLTSAEPKAVFEWCEAIREEYINPDNTEVGKPYYVPVDTLIKTVKEEQCGLENDQDRNKVVQIIRNIYAEEFMADTKANGEALLKIGRTKKIIVAVENYGTPVKATMVSDSPNEDPKPRQSSPTIVPVDTVTAGIKITQKGKRTLIFDLPITHIMRWMGSKDWPDAKVQAAFQKLSLPIEQATMRVQMRSGKVGDKGSHGPPPKLDKNQEKALNSL